MKRLIAPILVLVGMVSAVPVPASLTTFDDVQITGMMGIGTTPSRAKLDVAGHILASDSIRVEGYTAPYTSGAGLELGYVSGTGYVTGYNRSLGRYTPLVLRGAPLIFRNGGVDVLTVTTGNLVGIGTSNPTTKLQVAGDIRVDGTGTVKVMEILGGSDLAEKFRVHTDATEEKAAPGMVLCIDPDHPGELLTCRKPYDSKVAGVISGAGGLHSGMVMGQAGTLAFGDLPVTLAGRVYCLADATQSAIAPGDLLTTSASIGHAMKATDHDRATGAILGKAMTPLAKGEKGLVLVLVSLH